MSADEDPSESLIHATGAKEVFEEILPNQTWVVFTFGTVVIVDEAETEESARTMATDIMTEYGPVYPGCSAGEFVNFLVH